MNRSRREFIRQGAGALVVSLLPIQALAATFASEDLQRHISLYNTHTGESIDICYYGKGAYCPDALNKINHILRDHRANKEQPIDVHLLDALYAVRRKVRSNTPFHVISGYRSPSTNAMLRKTTNGVARTSYHTKGQAIDIRLPGYQTHRLRDLCIALKSGGVGYYGDSDFVHLDTGPVRTW
ncbi:MAG: DUF882 domain-containing protein [Desulfobacteraceae bacterium]